jgi:hypothetical protein
MRHVLGLTLGTLLLFGCSDLTEVPVGEIPGPDDAVPLSTASELFDGSSDAEGANPHFFFLSPLVSDPDYSGTADDGQKPVVTVCNTTTDPWDPLTQACPDVLVEFSMDALEEDDQVKLDPGVKYWVVWKTDRHPAPEGQSFRVSVSILGQPLGWVDVKSYGPSAFASFRRTAPEGHVAIQSNGSANITFRIEEGALEAAFCELNEIEDCDVLILDHETGGSLEVFDGSGNLGSKVTVPAGPTPSSWSWSRTAPSSRAAFRRTSRSPTSWISGPSRPGSRSTVAGTASTSSSARRWTSKGPSRKSCIPS